MRRSFLNRLPLLMPRIYVDVAAQRLTLYNAAGAVQFTAAVSTGAAGVGTEQGSGKTPTGHFVIYSKHGTNAPLNTVFRGRLPVGLYNPQQDVGDAILARILCLHGTEPRNANTLARYIYLHGTADTARLGTPVSHGCIRLAPADAAALYAMVPLGTAVEIR